MSNRAVIFTALSIEYKAVREHLTNIKEEIHPKGTVYEKGNFICNGQTWEVGILEIGHDNDGATMETEQAINYFNPTVALFIGVAAGIKDVKLGDVVVATKIYGHELNKVGVTIKTRLNFSVSSYSLIQRARAEAKKDDWRQRIKPNNTKLIDELTQPDVFIAPIIAGEKVIESTRSKTWDFLHNKYSDAVAVEMEGFGFFLNSIFIEKTVQVLAVRGISDLVDYIKNDKVGWQEIASKNASAFAFEVLAKLLPNLQETTFPKKLKPQPAYLLKLTLEDIRCFGPSQILDLSDGKDTPRQWTIILGDNGTGKTTLLQSIVALTPVYGSVYYNGVLSKRINLRVDDIVDAPYNWRPNRSQNSIYKINGNYSLGTKLTEKHKSHTASVYAEINFGGGGRNSTGETLGYFLCCAYGATRYMGETKFSSNKLSDEPVASLLLENVPLLNAEEWFLQADYLAVKSSKTKSLAVKRRDKINEILKQILPEVSDIRVDKKSWRTQKPVVEFKTPFGWISLKDLSLGYRTLIAWIVDFARRLFEAYPNSKNPLAESAIVLIDEIDLHLHPKWQRSLIDYISNIFINTQFIVTAHSPLIVQSAPNANIALLKRKDDYVVIDNNIETVRGWRIDQILTSDLFGIKNSRPPYQDKLLEERKNILSKGDPSEKDKKRLKELEQEIGYLPTGSNLKEDRTLKAMEEFLLSNQHKSND